MIFYISLLCFESLILFTIDYLGCCRTLHREVCWLCCLDLTVSYQSEQLVFIDKSSVDHCTTYQGCAWSIQGTKAQCKAFFVHGQWWVLWQIILWFMTNDNIAFQFYQHSCLMVFSTVTLLRGLFVLNHSSALLKVYLNRCNHSLHETQWLSWTTARFISIQTFSKWLKRG